MIVKEANTEKSIFASKTFWINILTIIAALSTEFIAVLPDFDGTALGILGLVNIVLRIITKRPTYVV